MGSVGRPSLYSEELAKNICALISSGESVKKISKRDDMPSEFTIYKWIGEHPEFSKQYAHARAAQVERYAEDIEAIADNVDVDSNAIAKARLQIDSRKWLLSKMIPKKYGEKIAIGGDEESPPISVAVRFVKPDGSTS